MKSVNLKVDPELWKAAKLEAIRRNQKLMEFVAEAIKKEVNSSKKH